MLRNTAISINSNNNNKRNHRKTVILALCKLCILHFLTPARWKMRIKVRCVFEKYQMLKKLCKSNKKQWPKWLKPHSFWVYVNYAYLLIYLCFFFFFFFFFFLWNFEQAFGWGPERKSLWSKCIGEICVMVVYIKIIFLRLILNWRSLCKLSRDATYRRK